MQDKLTAFFVIMLAVLAAHFVYDAYAKQREKKEIEQTNAQLMALMQLQQQQTPAPQTTV